MARENVWYFEPFSYHGRVVLFVFPFSFLCFLLLSIIGEKMHRTRWCCTNKRYPHRYITSYSPAVDIICPCWNIGMFFFCRKECFLCDVLIPRAWIVPCLSDRSRGGCPRETRHRCSRDPAWYQALFSGWLFLRVSDRLCVTGFLLCSWAFRSQITRVTLNSSNISV